MSAKSFSFMPEDVQRLMGKDAQRDNILAAKLVAEVVKTTLGPKGMDKMLVSPTGEIIVTNDGVTIMNEMKIEHPVVKMMVEIARTQEFEVGDGTTTSVMLAGKLLENAEKLLDMKIHPTIITKGYKLAAEKCKEILEEISLKISPDNNEELLKQVAMTAMTGKGADNSKEKFAKIIVDAVKRVEVEGKIDSKDIKIEKLKGSGIDDTELILGVVLGKGRVSYDMPKVVRDAKIALVDFPLELRNFDMSTKISVGSPDQLQSFVSNEERNAKSIVNSVIDSGANVLFCQKGIDDFSKYLLSKEGIYACSRVSKGDLENIAKATGGRIVNNFSDLSAFELGDAHIVESVNHGDNSFTYVKGCKNPKSVTILVKGGTGHVVDEIERALKDGIGDVICSSESGLVVAGGGAIEVEIAKRLREFARSLSSDMGREKLAVDEFASALEFIPVTLAENAGMDPIEVLTEIKSKHDSGERNAGLNLFTGKVENVLESRIIEPAKIKTQAINSASEVAVMVLRIDDVIASKSNKNGNMNFSGNAPDYFGGLN